jgi:competence protein ComFC
MNPTISLSLLASGWDRLLALFYPEVCQICREQRATHAESYLCVACRNGRDGIKRVEVPFCDCCGLPFEGDITVQFECANCLEQELHFRSARAAVEFSGVTKEIIHRYKYNHAAWFEPLLADLLITAAKPALRVEDWDWIVPIPLHWARLRDRTFNQSEQLARHLSRATGIPVHYRLLKRIRPTHTQTRLTRAERTENVKRAFAYRARHRLDRGRIILVDDVLTTGATASACAKLLKQNGASVVDVWTVARGILK